MVAQEPLTEFLVNLRVHFPSNHIVLLSSSAEANKYSTGVKSYDVSLDTQTATVVAEPTLDYDTVLKTIAKTGKKVNSGEADGEVKSVEVLAT